MRVLIVDNQSCVREALRFLIEQVFDMEVFEVDKVDTILEIAKKNRPDLFIFNYELKGLDLYKLLPALRNLSPEMVIIALSVRPEARESALVLGVDEFIHTWESVERLIRVLENVHEKHKFKDK